MNNLPTIKQDAQLILEKSKMLIHITNKILFKNNDFDLKINYKWMENLWSWADSNDIMDLEWIDDDSRKKDGYWKGFPRDSDKVISLRKLRLSEYNLVWIPDEISNLLGLTELHLRGNEFETIPLGVFNLKNLVHLCAHKNQLSELPKEIGNLINLKELYLDENQLTELPKEIGNLSNLTILKLSKNQLNELPKEIEKLTNLEILFLDENYLLEIPEAIGNFSNLTWLGLSKNQLIKLPKEIGNLSNLTMLWLSKNQLNELPKEIEKLTNLEILFLQESHLSNLPIEIGNLVNLTKLALDVNSLLELPKEIGNLINLTMLGLTKNQLTEVPKEIKNLVNLTWLGLGKNQLTEIPKEIGSLTNLEQLFFGENHLSNLPIEIGNLVNLTKLTLENNNFLELPKEIGNLVNLKVFSFSSNQIAELPKEIENLTNLEELFLFDNPNLILSFEQKEWIKKLQENGCNVFMDDDLLERGIKKLNPYQNLISELASIFEDYRKDEGLNPNPVIVERWINQFSPHNREVILSEMIHIFKKMYISEQKVNDFLLGLTINSKLTNSNSSHFWKNVSLLNIQQDGESQKIMTEKFSSLILNQFGVVVSINDFSKEHYIYVDDLLFSGMKLRTDLTYFLERAPLNAKIDVIYIGYFTSGEYYVKEKWFKSNNHKNITLNVWRMFELENRNNCNHASDVLIPTIETVKDEPSITDFIQSQGSWVTRDVNSQSTSKCAGNNIFSTEENRQIMEKEFTLAGLKINSSIRDQNKKAYWKPLGLSTFKGLGFGAMITTYRNCPNNTPLALWWGDWDDNQVWTPLFNRKTYNRNSVSHD